MSILLVLDGSSENQAATDLSLRWGRRFNASVTALGIVDEEAIAAPESTPIGGDAFKERRDEDLIALAHEHVDAALAAFAAGADQAAVRHQTVKRTSGSEEEILSAAQAHDLIVISSRTHFTAPEGWESDRTLQSLLGECSRPIVAVPPHPCTGAGTLIAYSGETHSAQALQDMVANRLHDLGPNYVLTIDRRSEAAARQAAELGAEFLRTHGAKVMVLAVVSHEPLDELIVREARERGVELLVMGSRHQSRLMAYLAASTTSGVLRQARCPVFLAS